MADYYPPVSFHFRVEFSLQEATADTYFQEVSGLNAEISTEEIKEGGQNEFTYKVPVRGKYGNLVLKRGMNLNSSLINWVRDAIENFSFSPTLVIVNLLDQAHEPLATWKFYDAYPVKLSVSDLKAEENAFVVETMELAYKKFERTE